MEALAAKADSEAGAERAAALAERLGAEIAAYAETVRREQEERASLERQLKSMQGKVRLNASTKFITPTGSRIDHCVYNIR